MSEVVFDKGIVTYTFLVTTPTAALRNELLTRFPQALDAIPDEERKLLDDPQFLAQSAVSDLIDTIIKKTQAEKTWPQGSTVQVGFEGKEADNARVAPLRQRIDAGELSAQLVTVRLGVTRNKETFPGLTWLTSQIRDEPGDGLVLLYTEAVQVLA